MTTAVRQHASVRFPIISALWPVIGLPALFAVLGAQGPRWVLMWALAFGTYAGLKWLSFVAFRPTRTANFRRSLAYLFLWPGMNAREFLDAARKACRPREREWIWAAVNVTFGLCLLLLGVPTIARASPLAAGWVGIVAIGFLLHFGLLYLLSLGWRQAGIRAVAIMNAPYRSASVSEFWGRRWNLAFRDLAHQFVFRAFVGAWGVTVATLAVFLASGLIHDLVISGAAGGGYGGPTLYFLIQAAGLFLERSRCGKRIGLGRGWAGWIFCGLVTVGPVGLLFHRPFVERVVVPMLRAMGLI
jgi:alginate O-acetyltransferase complex protein AlgI